ncbi:MAG TPA: hypothetical protein PK530_04135 [Anaerolineales bacterium]|nr:hypothetical protein [Anaerolineales bacterium]
MIHYVTIAGRERPVCFDNSLAYEYEKNLGRPYLADLAALFDDLRVVAQRVGTDDVATAALQMPIVRFVDVMHCALRLGHRKERHAIDFDEYAVADWLLDDTQAVSSLTTLLAEANFDPNAKPAENGQDTEPDAGKKKKAGTTS